MITRVRLTNWKSHGETALDFGKGTNVLVGVMGAGKSAVLDAISFALFGTFPAVKAGRISLDGCITNKPGQRTKASVDVAFTVGGKNYSVLRELTLGKGTARSELREGGKLLEGPQTKRVTEEVERILGMDYDLFSRAVYSEQNQMDYFLQIPAKERKRKIDELLRIDKFESARASATKVANQLAGEAEEIGALGRAPLPDSAGDEKALAGLEARQRHAAEAMAKAKRGLAEIEKATGVLEAKERRAKSLRDEITSARSKAEAYASREAELKKELAAVGKRDIAAELKAKGKEFDATGKEIIALESGALRRQKAEAERALAQCEARVSELERREAEREALKNRLGGLAAGNWREALAKARKERDSLLAKQAELEAAPSEPRKRLGALADAGDKCPVCDSEITGAKRKELEHGAKSAIEKAIASLERTKRALAAIDLAAIEAKAGELDRVEMRLAELGSPKELDEAKKKLKAAQKEAEALGAKAEADEKRLSQLRRGKEALAAEVASLESMAKAEESLGQAAAEKARLAARAAAAEQELAAVKFDEAALAAARDGAKALAAKAGELEAEARSIGELVTERGRLLAEMAERRKEIEAMAKRAGELKAAASSMGTFRSALESTQAELREHFVAETNYCLNDIWRQIYPYGDYSALRLGVVDGDYVLQARTLGGEWVAVDGVASGGERSTAALALRIAFSMVLAPQLSWLVLDEPTHNLDARGVEQLAEAMREALPTLVDQIFVITHDEQMESAVSGSLYRLERDKASDGATTAVLVAGGNG